MKKISDEQLKKQLKSIAKEAQDLAVKQARLYLKLEHLKDRAVIDNPTRIVPNNTDGFCNDTPIFTIDLRDLMS